MDYLPSNPSVRIACLPLPVYRTYTHGRIKTYLPSYYWHWEWPGACVINVLTAEVPDRSWDIDDDVGNGINWWICEGQMSTRQTDSQRDLFERWIEIELKAINNIWANLEYLNIQIYANDKPYPKFAIVRPSCTEVPLSELTKCSVCT